MELWVSKTICLFALWIILTVFTALPIWVSELFHRKGELGRNIVTGLTCFGGGVFLGTYFTLMAPEVREILEVSLLRPNNIHYPLPELITACGFFLVLVAEKLIMDYSKKLKDSSSGPIVTVEYTSANGTIPESTPNGVIDGQKATDGVYIVEHTDGHSHSMEDCDSTGRSLLLLIAMSFDHIFEGVSLGLKRTQVTVWNMFIAIVAHEVVIAFSIGIELVKHNPKKRVLCYAFLYGIACPIGVAMGTVVLEATGSSVQVELANGILQAISTGVFLYVTFFEILGGQINGHSPWYKILSVFLGFGFMVGLAALPNSDIEESESPQNGTEQFSNIWHRTCPFC